MDRRPKDVRPWVREGIGGAIEQDFGSSIEGTGLATEQDFGIDVDPWSGRFR